MSSILINTKSKTSHSVPFRASPVPIQFKNPLASAKQKDKDHKVLVDSDSKSKSGDTYAQVDARRMDPPANQTFDKFAESL